MRDTSAISRFLREHEATPVGLSPSLPILTTDEDQEETKAAIDLTVEIKPADNWEPKPVPEQPVAQPGEFPVRFIDGSQAGQPVLSLSVRGRGWPIPLFLSEVGAVALRLDGRGFVREFHVVERVLSFVADPFPWAQVEGFAAELSNNPDFRIRVLSANMPDLKKYSPFDYEVMRTQARARAVEEMTNLERLALAVDRSVPTLVDGPLDRVMGEPEPGGPLVVGMPKVQAASYLNDATWPTLLKLRPGQRTPVFKIVREGSIPVATWYLKLAGGPRLAPNWGYVRVEVPWNQFEHRGHDFGFVNRLSRWLIDARCRTESYARMPVSLDPIVRAEDALKPLFTPLPILVNRLYRQAGLFRRTEL
jgi:hypothetical protein